LALAPIQMGNYELAIAAYRDAIRLAPQYSYLPYNLGLVFQKTNRGGEAEDAYRNAIAIADTRAAQLNDSGLKEAFAERAATPRIALGLLKASQKRDLAAEKHYKDALDLLAPFGGNRNVLIASHNLALLLTGKKDRWRDAETMLRKNVEKRYVPSQQAMAEWLVHRGDFAEAAKIYESLLAELPDFTAARLSLAGVLEKLGDDKGQRQNLLLAYQYDCDNPRIIIELARFEAGQKNWDAARRAYQEALNLTSDSALRKRIASALRRLP
jgi:tetratricopeptide (TPR) repeat protein